MSATHCSAAEDKFAFAPKTVVVSKNSAVVLDLLLIPLSILRTKKQKKVPQEASTLFDFAWERLLVFSHHPRPEIFGCIITQAIAM